MPDVTESVVGHQLPASVKQDLATSCDCRLLAENLESLTSRLSWRPVTPESNTTRQL